MASAAEKRALREKGHTTYNPNEGFGLRVHWITHNPKAAEELIRDGLQGCALATRRDTPCVPLYFFRKAYDQRPSAALDERTKLLKDHPHYAKVFKSIEMGIPMQFQKNKLAAGGIDETPLSWGANKELDAETKAKIGFAPCSISLSEFYLDSRAFYEHADSDDYLKSYGATMQASRSLDAKVHCLGSPSEALFTTVLDAFLQAEQCEDALLSFDKSLLPSSSIAFVEFALLDLDESNWQATCKAIFNAAKASVRSALPNGEEVQIEMVIALSNLTALCEALQTAKLGGGQVFGFSGQDGTEPPAERPSYLPASFKYFKAGKDLFGRTEDGSGFWAGYALHPLANTLQADENVHWKGF